MVQKTIEGIPLIVKDTIEKVDEEAKVILFGSRARGDFRLDSDWDFLILTKKEASWQFQKEKSIHSPHSLHASVIIVAL